MTPRVPRNSSLDVARGIGILLVIYGHSLEMLFLRSDSVFIDSAFEQWRAIYAFHMPLFFLLSGWALALSGRREIPWVRSGSLVLLAMANHLIGAVLQVLDGWRHGELPTLQTFKYMIKPLLVGSDFSLAILWFPVSLAAVQLLFALWRTPRNAAIKPLIAAICLASFAAGAISEVHVPNAFQLKSWLPGLVFFALGHALPNWKRISISAGALCVAGALLAAPLNHGCSFTPTASCGDSALHGHFAVWLFLGRIGFIPLFYATALLGCTGVIALSNHLESRGLAYCGRNSLYLFLVNSYVLAFIVSQFKRIAFDDIGWIGYLAVFVCAVALHLALLLVTRPFFKGLERVALDATRRSFGWLQRPRVEVTEPDGPPLSGR